MDWLKLDGQIESLRDGGTLTEAEVKVLCEAVSACFETLSRALSHPQPRKGSQPPRRPIPPCPPRLSRPFSSSGLRPFGAPPVAPLPDALCRTPAFRVCRTPSFNWPSSIRAARGRGALFAKRGTGRGRERRLAPRRARTEPETLTVS